jgi:hypothetical protein
MRCWRDVFPNTQEVYINRFNPDIFIHTWDNEGYWKHSDDGMGIHHEGSPEISAQDVIETYSPKRLVIENFETFEPAFAERAKYFTDTLWKPRNGISMFYKMISGMQLLETHMMSTGAKYDLVIRSRPDMKLLQPLPDFDTSVLTLFYHRNHLGTGVGDIFQAGTYENVRKFSELGLYFEEYYDELGVYCPHIFSEHHLKKCGIPFDEIPFEKLIQHNPTGFWTEWDGILPDRA